MNLRPFILHLNAFSIDQIVFIFCNRYFPKGGGYCIINARPVQFLNRIDLTNSGDVVKIFGWSFVAGTLPIHVSKFFASQFIEGEIIHMQIY